ncbi:MULTISPECIES: monovalent cation/H+ antiporter subunit D [unclassified Sinorhizobium]|uniref:monovalent cation/H+ antiporter subunit D n=1 Tax=unclassified Sinorhizobium TaxID=2613772 RepID=UPI0024C2D5E1|nr:MULTISPECIES: monovalent cation/H+ antiporter subunit D [unclassified Sinorhizobium]MDK1375397.1 monovalent cation/H+ antiporter subunit D [Sinorhizobium sp. 6-70]MDK1477935.1 monovalent cation/H+ antiporter subunit D [Sinorhizobium sp. 6-117]
MIDWLHHLLIIPILLPLAVGAALIPIDERNRMLKGVFGFGSTLIVFVVATILMHVAANAGNLPETGIYQLGNWPAPFGIVLVLDRLSALMLCLTAGLALAAQVYSMARWHTAGHHFHSLFQLLIAGLNGAFLTGDIFNLFVFFEMMLAASYGLLLHGSGPVRVKAGLHYIAINLAASSLFLIGVSLIYGVTGTLNMADLATKLATLTPENRQLVETGAAILGIAFLVKAGMWPLSFWLPPAYAAATPPVAAVFAILTKVGIYVIVRLHFLIFGAAAGPSAGFGQEWLVAGGMLTIAFGAIGVLASQAMGRLAGYSVLVSSGTLLAAIGLGHAGMLAGALFYLVSSTLTISAFFLLIELVDRGRDAGADVLAVTMEAYGDFDEDEEEEEIGVAIPGTMAVLGLCFCLCAVLLSGLPPLSGFVAKFAILRGLFDMPGADLTTAMSAADWTYVVLLILSGLAAMIAMNRIGIRTFWASIEGTVPRVFVIEITPVLVLLAACVFLSLQAGPAMRYMQATADDLLNPLSQSERVLSAPRAGGQ